MSNIGRIIADGFCNGKFGREYFLQGSVIEAEGADYVVIRDQEGVPHFGYFGDDSWPGVSGKQTAIDEWCEQ
jgi:hypothetical protein